MPLVPGIDVPTSLSGQGTTAQTSVLSNHLYNAGMEKPEILESLIIKSEGFAV